MCCARVADGDAISRLFSRLFLASHNTRLHGGAPEPFYEPPANDCAAVIHYREDYAASALHEVAHWCIAGPERRRLPDYGYWYEADGRGDAAQGRFQSVEARPQALEWCFAQAAGLPFRISLDNLDDPPTELQRRAFAGAVVTAGEALVARGLPPRGRRFFDALAREFRAGFRVTDLCFSRDSLR